jgi:GAF domain-containing protein
MERSEFSSKLSDSDVEIYSRLAAEGTADCLASMEELGQLNTAAQRVFSLGIRSLLRTPFRLSDGTLGMVTLGNCTPNRYTHADSERLLELCRPIAVAIDRVGILARMNATSALLDAKTRVLGALVPGATVESAGEVFVSETRRLFGATYAVAAVLTAGEIRVAGVVGTVPGGRFTLESPSLQTASANDTLTARLATDLAFDARGAEESQLAEAGFRSMMRVPIVDSAGAARGVVLAASPTEQIWVERDLETFNELSQSLGLVFERAQLFDEAAEKAAKVQALTQLLSTLSLQSPPEEVASMIAHQVRQYLNADAVMVYAFDRDSHQRIRVAFDAVSGDPLPNERVSLEESGAYHGLQTEPHVLYSSLDSGASPDWIKESAALMGLGSAVCVRLDAANEPVGMIAAGSVDPARLAMKDLESLAAVAAPVGMILERARAVTTLRLQTQRTQAVLDILAALGPSESFDLAASPVAEALRVMYGADHCSIVSFEDGVAKLIALESSIVEW